MNAKQMKANTRKVCYEKVKREVNKIYKNIQDASNNGKRELRVDGNLSIDARTVFEIDGFKIKTNSYGGSVIRRKDGSYSEDKNGNYRRTKVTRWHYISW